MKVSVVILAAGNSKRMYSNLPKILHKIANYPLISYVIDVATTLSPTQIISIINPNHTTVIDFLDKFHPNTVLCSQETPLGTGHAILCSLPLISQDAEYVIILFGDTPFITQKTLNKLLDSLKENPNYVLGVLGFRTNNPGEYGRLVIQNSQLISIIESKDLTPNQTTNNLCNSGVMVIKRDKLTELITSINNNNHQNEFYLTDLVKIATNKNYICTYLEAVEEEVLGINDKAQLAYAEKTQQHKLRKKFLTQGVILLDPDNVTFSYDTVINRDVIIHPYVVFGTKVEVENNVEIKSFCHIEGATLKPHTTIGPFARIRHNSIIETYSKIGNFVEVKNSHIAHNSKINHLSYIGDATIGYNTNIGAGTITCNYDGLHKHKTTIGNNVFIGSNSSLIAPLIISDNSLIGAGSTININIPKNALAIARTPTKIINEGSIKFQNKSQSKNHTKSESDA
ncbi:MAG: bifunctional UDP-N-acetylglucosamine diphosphorylase/glucosamine-1-phosphate N-acetyltransferase GlmU [Rickettsiales endosymbiont of Dermacentor nuttalli]